MCVAPTRAEAEDIAALVEVDFEELPAVVDMVAAIEPGAPLVHEDWGDNVVLETLVDDDLARNPRARRDQRARGASAPRASACRRWRAAAWSRTTTGGSTSSPSIRRRRCRTSTAPGSRSASASTRGAIRVDRARRRRRLRLQGHPAAGGGVPRLARDEARAAGALARGPVRAADGQRQLPRALLRHHRLRRCRRAAARDRLRGDRRLGRLLVLSVLGVPRGGAGRLDPARALSHGRLPLPHLVGGDQQAADPAVPRRRAHRRVLRARAGARRDRARGRQGAATRSASRTWCRRTRCPS